jgi:hypothetical protein
MVLYKAQERCVLCDLLLFFCQKWSIKPVQSNLHIKFGFLIDFDMKIKLNVRIDHFWLKIKNRAQNTQYSCALQSTVVGLYIYRVMLWCFAKHKIFYVSRPYLEFKISNGRSKPLNIIFILKYSWRSNFIFVRSTQVIRTTRSTVAKLSIYIFLEKQNNWRLLFLIHIYSTRPPTRNRKSDDREKEKKKGETLIKKMGW